MYVNPRRSERRATGILAVSLAGYTLTFILSSGFLGPSTLMLTVIPVLLAGWFFRVNGGVAVGLFSVLLNILWSTG